MSVYLRVKIKSLAVEASIIRREEHRAKPRWQRTRADSEPDTTFFSLQAHRRLEVRPEARVALLAYGFLRGRTYRQIEHKCYEPPNWSRVIDLVRKFGALPKETVKDAVLEWGSMPAPIDGARQPAQPVVVMLPIGA